MNEAIKKHETDDNLSTEEIRLRWHQADEMAFLLGNSDEEDAEYVAEWCHWFAVLKDRGYAFDK